MTLDEIAKLPAGTEILVRAKLTEPRPDVDGDIVITMQRASDPAMRRYIAPAAIHSVAPPAPLKAGDKVSVHGDGGSVVAVFGEEAWVNFGTAEEPNCCTYAISILKAA